MWRRRESRVATCDSFASQVLGENPAHNEKLKRVLDEINGKIGWHKIKVAVNELVEVCNANYNRELDGHPPLPLFLNRMFLGNPGTGKTTCAKLYGQVLKELNFLSNGEVLEKAASDLSGAAVGEAKQKTLALLEGAKGKVLLIDEAYGLDDGQYGKQALDTLVEKVQVSGNDDIAVLLMGYTDPMLSMLRNQNAGLARRFAPDQAFYFEDYTSPQLLDIMQNSCQRQNFQPSIDFLEKAMLKLESQRRSDPNFGNAGGKTIKSLINCCTISQRMLGLSRPSHAYTTVCTHPTAVNNLLNAAVQKAAARGALDTSVQMFLESCDVDLGPEEEEGDEDIFSSLDKLYRMEPVKRKLQQLRNAFALAEQEGDARPSLGHFVFLGAPGTGKTTVARAIATLLYKLRLIARNQVVETSGLNLTGQHVGTTKKVVEEQLDKAKGCVLFIVGCYSNHINLQLHQAHWRVPFCAGRSLRVG